MTRLFGVTLGLLLLSGCGDTPSDPMDAGSDDAGAADATVVCRSDAQCGDGLFCNGVERCAGASAEADARGCIPGTPPCTMECDEDADVCGGACEEPDADGDGHAAVACGGDDCDDTDGDRYPGNVEICDSLGRDEDCDPTTIGPDTDRDGFVDDRCCGPADEGGVRCGLDCDDLRDSVSPDGIDICNDIDDDCDGTTDEAPHLVFYVDADGDGFGLSGDPDDDALDAAVRPVRSCSQPEGYVLLDEDCNDEAPLAHPGSPELCRDDGVDEDCDGLIDEYGTDAASPAINPRIFYRDRDRDGYGTLEEVVLGCSLPSGFAPAGGDCREDRPLVNPGVGHSQAPDCPTGWTDSDAVSPVGAVYCDDHWECAIESVCGDVPPADGYDPVWDRNCDGRVTPIPVARCQGDVTGTCRTVSSTTHSAEDCGRITVRSESCNSACDITLGDPTVLGCR